MSKPTEIFYATEIIYHYQCPNCDGWWSVADTAPAQLTHCPHCGIQGEPVPHTSDEVPL